jgi:hypothetical protein
MHLPDQAVAFAGSGRQLGRGWAQDFSAARLRLFGSIELLAQLD